jgi:hypothetical protein
MGARVVRSAVVSAVLVALAMGSLVGTATAASAGGRVALKAPAVFTEAWWQTAVSTAGTDTLDRCDLGPRHIAFLAGTTGGAADRECTFDNGTPILVPLINVECSTIEGNGTTAAELRACAEGFADQFTDLSLTVDGTAVGNLTNFRVQTRVFSFTAVQGNVFGIPAGTTDSVADGYWALIPPLRPGVHTISFGGSYPPGAFSTLSNYTITVRP